MGEAPLISVRTQVVLDTLVGSMAEAVASRRDDPLGVAAEAALARAGGPREQRLARAGYLARAVELERFERAREPMPWLAARLPPHAGADRDEVAAALAAELAGAEPAERPDPGDGRAVSWRVPGPGGHVRHYLALREAGDEQAAGPPALAKRPWLFGFLVHCVEEAWPASGR